MSETTQTESLFALHRAVGHALARSKSMTDASTQVLGILCPAMGWDAGEVWSANSSDRVMHRVVRWPASSAHTAIASNVPSERPPRHLARRPLRKLRPNWPADVELAAQPDAKSELELAEVFRLPMEVHGVERANLRVFARLARAPEPVVVELMDSVGTQFARFLELSQEAQRATELDDRRRAGFDTSFDAIVTVDADGRALEFSATAQSLFGYSREHVVGRALDAMVIPDRLRERARAEIAKFRETGRFPWSGKHFSAFALHASGREFPVEFAAAPTRVDGAPALTICVRDVSARLASERELTHYRARLRSLMSDMLVTEERERKQLADDLHDGLSQILALARMKLAVLRSAVDTKLTGLLDDLEGLMREADRAARAVSFELSPPVLHHLGLEPALQWLVENVRTRYELEVSFEDDGQQKDLDEKPRVIAFRSIRELLINAAKHSHATRVQVRVSRIGSELCASVEDNGVGMDSLAALERGAGLFSIQERLNHVGGNMHIDSSPEQGTHIRLSLPLSAHQDVQVKS